MIDRRLLLASTFAWAEPFLVQRRAWAKGTYRGRVLAEWLGDNRRMRLEEPFEYIDPSGRRWPVPRGTEVDGASIPYVFWSIIGSPFEGPYRSASVVHDYYCDSRSRPSRVVHRVFYDAMLTSGVGEQRAWLMYEAVARFGPSWNGPKDDPRCDVIDEPEDFELCAQNTTKPPVTFARLDANALDRFASELKGKADESDLETLRRTASKL